VKGLIDTLLSEEQSARFTERREIASVIADCFDVTNPLIALGSVCFSARGEPLEIGIGGEFALKLVAQSIVSPPTLAEGSFAPLVPDATFENETHVKQVPARQLNLPTLLIQESD
jgi:hypothetical protein